MFQLYCHLFLIHIFGWGRTLHGLGTGWIYLSLIEHATSSDLSLGVKGNVSFSCPNPSPHLHTLLPSTPFTTETSLFSHFSAHPHIHSPPVKTRSLQHLAVTPAKHDICTMVHSFIFLRSVYPVNTFILWLTIKFSAIHRHNFYPSYLFWFYCNTIVILILIKLIYIILFT